MSNHPELASQSAFYDKRWAGDRPIRALALQRTITILELISSVQADLGAGPRILGLGAGRGWLSSILATIGPVTAIELSEQAVKEATIRYPTINFISGDIFALKNKLGQVDLVVSQEVIEHVEDQQAFVQIAADCLRDGGYFVLTTPNKWVQDHRTDEEHEDWGLQPTENWLDKADVRALLRRRFEILTVNTIIPGFGSKGIFRVVNSFKLRRLLAKVGLLKYWDSACLKLGFGLHLVVLAKKIV